MKCRRILRQSGQRGLLPWSMALLMFSLAPTFAQETRSSSSNSPDEKQAPEANSKETSSTEPEYESAELDVSGFGFWGNRELEKTLRLLETDPKAPRFYNASFIEDGAMIIVNRVKRDGYLEPVVTADVVLADGSTRRFQWNKNVSTLLPRPLEASEVHFRIKEGTLFYYKKLQFEGLNAIQEESARQYFVEGNMLLKLKSSRIYTPNRLHRSVNNLTEALKRQGYQDAEASVRKKDLSVDYETGEVECMVTVQEGRQYLVQTIRVEIRQSESQQYGVSQIRTNAPYSRFWEQNFVQELRAEQYQKGYPDTEVKVYFSDWHPQGEKAYLDVVAQVNPGPYIEVGTVKFKGNEKTLESVLRRRVKVEPGEKLNRVAVEDGRYRLSRLGVFDSVTVEYEEAEGNQRNVVYVLEEGKEIDVSVLFGYGSYELLRGGIEVSQHNVWGRAHSSRLRAIQSMRSTSADYLYTMPELIGEDIDVFIDASGLIREEISFTREEFGGGAGLQRYFPSIQSDVGLRYHYEFLNARDAALDGHTRTDQARVASFILDIKYDNRDNPLIPQEGTKLYGALEFANQAFGGEVDYQRFELGASHHLPLGGGRYLHFGAAHGVALTLGADRDQFPFNKRFFPGGENTLRGYQQGEASPLNADGRQIGAETFLRGNVEFEQMLTVTWSVVVFTDVVGIAEDLGEYPFNEVLYSVGGGIRYKTVIGPARLEYGHNLNPREHDPTGTVHFSIGFPF